MADVIIVLIILAILAFSICYIVKEKKKGADGIMYEIIGHTSDAVDCFVCEAFKPFFLK